MSSEIIRNRYDIEGILECVYSNPNGDPDNNNMPRIEPDSGIGIITPVCLKRKIRDYVDLTRKGEEGYRIYIKNDASLNSKEQEAFDGLGIGGQDIAEMKKSNPEVEKNLHEYMAANFFDVRVFGAVLTSFTKNKMNGNIRGPVQFDWGKSVEPVYPLDVTVTRQAITTDADFGKKKTEMGRHKVIPYALYRIHATVSGAFAETTGMTEDDLNLILEALVNVFDLDKSSLRSNINMRNLFVFRHESMYGNYPSWKIREMVKVERNEDIKGAATKYGDYRITLDDTELPESVSLTRLI